MRPGLPARLRIAFAAGVLLLGATADAQPLDTSSQEALGAVLGMLRTPAQRSSALAGDSKAASADAQIRALTRGSDALVQDVYELAGLVLEDVAHGSGGDVQAITQALARAHGDPAGFAAMLSPRTLERLRELAGKLADQR